MTWRITGPSCHEAGCSRPLFKHGRCARCWGLARFIGKTVDPLETQFSLPAKESQWKPR